MGTRTRYHHGDLRRALLDEALALIGERGVARLSMREVAARVGVSHAAPYHHFTDKEALLRALARDGMALMGREMALAEERAGADAGERLLGIGLAYVTFAVEHPDYYAVFTAPELAAGSTPGTDSEEDDGGVWERLMSAVIACQSAGVLPHGDPVVLAVYLWSLVHGLAELWRVGPLAQLPHARAGLAALARSVLAVSVGTLDAGTGMEAPWAPSKEDDLP